MDTMLPIGVKNQAPAIAEAGKTAIQTLTAFIRGKINPNDFLTGSLPAQVDGLSFIEGEINANDLLSKVFVSFEHSKVNEILKGLNDIFVKLNENPVEIDLSYQDLTLLDYLKSSTLERFFANKTPKIVNLSYARLDFISDTAVFEAICSLFKNAKQVNLEGCNLNQLYKERLEPLFNSLENVEIINIRSNGVGYNFEQYLDKLKKCNLTYR